MAVELPPFEAFASIPRLSRECVVTEKIDGTNACVYIGEDGTVIAGSRNRWITPADDNHGFAAWVAAHVDELRGLGPGRHFGEWWGSGIQRRYGLAEKRFSLFNVGRWGDDRNREACPIDRPACCHVVPVLYRGMFSTATIDSVLQRLSDEGSVAAPGFMNPEGVIVYHARQLFKKTIGDDGHKSAKVKGAA